MLKWLKKNSFIFIIILGLILAFKNYTPGTFLSGWDTLHPEFNFNLAFQREISGVFRSEQGLGAVASHSHMADLPHLIILYILHLVSPTSILRYLYIFLNLILGPVGVYIFLNKYVVKNKIGAFLGSLFYLLNLGTLQIFTVPFEMFTTQYACIPWIFLFVTDYLLAEKKPEKKLFIFSVAILISAPMAYAATLWYLFFFILILYSFFLSFLTRSILAAKRSLIIIVVTIGINLFWILPNIYYVINHGKDVANALINQLFSPQAFLYNKEFGRIKDIGLIKNFLFDWNVYSGNNNFSQLLSPWNVHLDKMSVQIIGIIFALITFASIFYGIFKKHAVLTALTLPLLFCFFFLVNDNFPTAPIYSFFQDKIPLFKEAFRFPGDKILGIYTFLFAVYFAKGQEVILKRFKKTQIVYFLISFSLIIFYMLPAFRGNFINPYMRIQIPKYYFEMFDWFKSKPQDARVAELPINSFWGWKYYNWYGDNIPSFQGADFLQFGIKQPLLDRDFDRWSPYNEQYYREMSYAIYTDNPALLKSVLRKYNIKYILLDATIISPKDDPKSLLLPQIKKLLDQEGFIQEVKNFNNALFIYEIKSQTQGEIIGHPLFVSSRSKVYHEDFIYENYGNYINQVEGINFPLANFIDNLNLINPNFVQFKQTGIEINMQTDQSLNLPALTDTESYVETQLLIEKKNDKLTLNIYPVLLFKTNPAPISISAIFNAPVGKIIATVNQKSDYVLDLKENTPLSIGNAQLSTMKTNKVAIYSLNSKKTTFSDLSKLDYSLFYCRETENKEIFGIEQSIVKNSFYIFGKSNQICLSIPLGQFLKAMNSSEALIGVNFNYKSFISSELCIARNNACVNRPVKHNQSNYVAVNKEDAGELVIKLSVDTSSKTQANKAFIENFSIDIMDPVSRVDVFQDDIKKAIENTNTNRIQSSILTIPFSGEKKLGAGAIFSGENETYTTDLSTNSTDKQIIKDKNGDYIRYIATNGSVSDHFIYQNLPQDRAYLISITSRNVEGLPLTLCVTNHVTRHCDIYTTISPSGYFSKEVFLLPPQLKDQSGFDLNINNLGIGNIPSINDLKSIEIIPFPYRYLSQVFRDGTGKQTNKDVFVLEKSYEPGWKAYEIKNPSWLNAAFPFLFGKELKNHVLVNNWANGWILDNEKLITIFWPQYLEYLGFGILIITFVFVFARMRRKSKQPPAL